MKCSRSEDSYGMSSSILKHTIDLIISPLCNLINGSIAQGNFPSILKNTIIVPVYKKGDKNDPNNFRPIALTPIISQAFEYVLLQQLSTYFRTRKLLNDCQYGFRAGFGTIDAVEKVASEIYSNMDQRMITSATLIDLSKAFDTLSHTLLIRKLYLYGIEGKELNLLCSYLKDRNQAVKVNDSFSGNMTLNRGVPEGSVLGPFLFVVYMNDFPESLRTR